MARIYRFRHISKQIYDIFYPIPVKLVNKKGECVKTSIKTIYIGPRDMERAGVFSDIRLVAGNLFLC